MPAHIAPACKSEYKYLEILFTSKMVESKSLYIEFAHYWERSPQEDYSELRVGRFGLKFIKINLN